METKLNRNFGLNEVEVYWKLVFNIKTVNCFYLNAFWMATVDLINKLIFKNR